MVGKVRYIVRIPHINPVRTEDRCRVNHNMVLVGQFGYVLPYVHVVQGGGHGCCVILKLVAIKDIQIIWRKMRILGAGVGGHAAVGQGGMLQQVRDLLLVGSNDVDLMDGGDGGRGSGCGRASEQSDDHGGKEADDNAQKKALAAICGVRCACTTNGSHA
jgi:hypothetical protein